ncbi:MAG TPA: DUF2239 family protein [Geminicoccus sp.]|jgi:hypothetical protein|uniref:DUF2239 family protein n=1 Tax=Geminicoccus sp. TaxID=2024832 RepID=UPI002E351A0D|nr:DUF2239 family protein [Geminicoccus sp.]HEX2525397.1 DUF2239 family protein [Geminicoccus sp.]
MTGLTGRYSAFAGSKRLASGSLAEAALAAKDVIDHDDRVAVFVFEDASGRIVDLDMRGSSDDVLARLENKKDAAPRGPGRPKLGVVAREVTLLPRHWDWLASQPGGASVALRKLVDAARAANADADRMRLAREATDRFMVTLAGDLPGYEAAARAIYAGDEARFGQAIQDWPQDIREHAVRLAADAFPGPDAPDAQLPV